MVSFTLSLLNLALGAGGDSQIFNSVGGKKSKILRAGKKVSTPTTPPTATPLPKYGCTYSDASNFDSTANRDNGSCDFSLYFSSLSDAGGP